MFFRVEILNKINIPKIKTWYKNIKILKPKEFTLVYKKCYQYKIKRFLA